MNWLRAALFGCMIVIAACIPKVRGLTLRSDARLLGGLETAANVELPGSWVQSLSQPDRARWISPDNFSTVQFTLAPVTVDPAHCPEIAQRAAEESSMKLDWIVVLANEAIALGSQYSAPRVADKKLTSPEGHPGIVDFELIVPDPVTGPSQRLVIGRAICGNGGLVQIGCSTGYKKSDTIELCRQVIASVTVEGVVQNALTPMTPNTPAPPPPEPQMAPPPSSM